MTSDDKREAAINLLALHLVGDLQRFTPNLDILPRSVVLDHARCAIWTMFDGLEQSATLMDTGADDIRIRYEARMI
jgi:hypothetical protein